MSADRLRAGIAALFAVAALAAMLLPAPTRAQEPAPTDAGGAGAPASAPGGAEPAAGAPPEVAALPGDGEAAAPAQSAASVPAGVISIESAWVETQGQPLEQRVNRVRRIALEQGVWEQDAVALALIASAGPALDNASAAVTLAPHLPDARVALASARWGAGQYLGSLKALIGALPALWSDLEPRLWFTGQFAFAFAEALLLCGALVLLLIAGSHLADASHDLGDRLPLGLLGFGRLALLGALLLLPALAGEGALGIALGLAAVGVLYGDLRERIAVVAALIAILLGAWPLADWAGARLRAFDSDPVAEAALAAHREIVLPSEIVRLQAAGSEDRIAQQALAHLARRAGDFERALALYRALGSESSTDPILVNNAANVLVHLGRFEAAIAAYGRLPEPSMPAVALYNLAQVYGRAFRMDELALTLEKAQERDPALVADLTNLQGAQLEGFVVDLPFDETAVGRRMLAQSQGGPFAAELRAVFAPGLLGSSLPLAAGCLALAVAGAWGLGLRHAASYACGRCGRRVCPRCDLVQRPGGLCESCHDIFYQSDQTDRELRIQRTAELNQRRQRIDRLFTLGSLLLPGLAGLHAKRVGAVGAACFGFAAFCAFVIWPAGTLVDPLLAARTTRVAFLLFGALAALLYVATTALAITAGRRT